MVHGGALPERERHGHLPSDGGKKKARDGRIASLASELKDPLRAELKELIKGGRIVDAAKKYQHTNRLDDVFLAIGVMKAINQ